MNVETRALIRDGIAQLLDRRDEAPLAPSAEQAAAWIERAETLMLADEGVADADELARVADRLATQLRSHVALSKAQARRAGRDPSAVCFECSAALEAYDGLDYRKVGP